MASNVSLANSICCLIGKQNIFEVSCLHDMYGGKWLLMENKQTVIKVASRLSSIRQINVCFPLCENLGNMGNTYISGIIFIIIVCIITLATLCDLVAILFSAFCHHWVIMPNNSHHHWAITPRNGHHHPGSSYPETHIISPESSRPETRHHPWVISPDPYTRFPYYYS